MHNNVFRLLGIFVFYVCNYNLIMQRGNHDLPWQILKFNSKENTHGKNSYPFRRTISSGFQAFA